MCNPERGGGFGSVWVKAVAAVLWLLLVGGAYSYVLQAQESLTQRKMPAFQRQCLHIYEKFSGPYLQWIGLSGLIDLFPVVDAPHLRVLIYTQKSDCARRKSARRVRHSYRQMMNNRSGKVAVIFPHEDSQHAEHFTHHFKQGMLAACKVRSCGNHEDFILVRRLPEHRPEVIKRYLRDLYFRERVSVIIGGWRHQSAKYFDEFGSLFHIPVMLFHSEGVHHPGPFTFFISPSEKLLATTLLREWQRRVVSSVAILAPSHHSQVLVNAVHAQAQNYGVTVQKMVSYDGTNMDSMMRAAEQILTVGQYGREQRKEEWEAMVKAHEEEEQTEEGAQTQAERRESGQKEEKTESDLEKIFLKPQVNFQMLLIPDNVKVVRHFTKLFQYLRLERVMPLAGTHLWRAQELITPWDKMLEGSFFVDFIGDYGVLPQEIYAGLIAEGEASVGPGPAAGTTSSLPSSPTYFIHPLWAAPLDYRLIGYRAMSIAVEVQAYVKKNKSHLHSALKNLYIIDSLFPVPQVFSAPYLQWPTYVLGLAAGKVHLRSDSQVQRTLPYGVSQRKYVRVP